MIFLVLGSSLSKRAARPPARCSACRSEAWPAFLVRDIMGGLASLWPTFLGGFHGTPNGAIGAGAVLLSYISSLTGAVVFAFACPGFTSKRYRHRRCRWECGTRQRSTGRVPRGGAKGGTALRSALCTVLAFPRAQAADAREGNCRPKRSALINRLWIWL